MITAVHTLIYSDDPTATRAFLKDVLRWPFVAQPGSRDDHPSASDSGSQDPADWLIFRTGPSELGVHPGGDLLGATAPRDRAGLRRHRGDHE